MRSPKSTSSMLPVETKWEKPIFSSTAQSRTDVHRAPDWETKATWPGRGMAPAKLALRERPGEMKPRQFGPRILNPSKRRASARTDSSRASPAGPVSRKPEETMIRPPTPAWPHSRTRPGTWAAAAQTMPRSGTLGSDATSRKQGMPITASVDGFTG